jgi:CRP-like cAMP-binding protein
MRETTSVTLAELVRQFRSAAHLSQEALAERTGLSARTVSDNETGVATAPRATTLALLIEGLRLDARQQQRLFETCRTRTKPTPSGEDLTPERLREFGRDVRLAAGETLFTSGQIGDTMYFIVSGGVHLAESGVDLGPGSFVGEIAIHSPDAKRTQSATATAHTRLIELSRADMPALHRRFPDLGLQLLRLVTSRLLENAVRLRAPADTREITHCAA